MTATISSQFQKLPDRYRPAVAVLAIIVVFGVYAIAADGFTLFLQRLLDSLNNGFIYAAMALALVLIYKATGLVNFAQGEMAMFGTFISYVLIVERGLPVVVGILLAMAISAAAAAGMERVLIRPFDPSNHLALVIVTLGMFLSINAIAGIIWLYDPRAYPSPFPSRLDDFVKIFDVRVRYESIGIWISVILIAVGVNLLLRKTKIGLAFRAVSSNLESSRLVGIHVGRTLQFGWAIAAAVGSLAGALVARTTLLEPNLMGRLLIYSFAAATLGGLDSIGGAIIGGLVVALAQTMLGGYFDFIGGELSLSVALGVIVLVLVVRPSGLYGSRRVERV